MERRRFIAASAAVVTAALAGCTNPEDDGITMDASAEPMQLGPEDSN